MGSQESRRFYLLTYPRTASSLLVKMLALDKQEAIATPPSGGGYYFLATHLLLIELGLRSKGVDAWTPAERDQVMQSYQHAVDKLEAHLATAEEQGKNVFTKEHVGMMLDPVRTDNFLHGEKGSHEKPWNLQFARRYSTDATRSRGNDTLLPDDVLQTWLPTFLIRHPALAFPSLYRAGSDLQGAARVKEDDSDWAIFMTLRWTRRLHDWFAQRLSTSGAAKIASHPDVNWPLVLDADDVMHEPQVVVRFCEILGLDATKLQRTWEPASQEEVARMSHAGQVFTKSLQASTGILEGKAARGDLDIDAEAKQWREEFGERVGAKMERWVRDAMPDYEFLRARRLRAESAHGRRDGGD